MSRIIPVGEELPPMDGPEPAPSSHSHPGKPKERPDSSKAKAGERFAVLNAFVDSTLAGLSRGEIAVWLVLYRDTRDGTARTSYADLVRRAGLTRRNVGRKRWPLNRLDLLNASPGKPKGTLVNMLSWLVWNASNRTPDAHHQQVRRSDFQDGAVRQRQPKRHEGNRFHQFE